MSRRLIDLCLDRGRSSRQRVSRRQLLQAGLTASAGLLSGSASSLSFAKPESKASRVLVVGGGFSGLACAFELAASGYEVTVFEARRRVGGRVHSIGDLVLDKNVEGGAELVGSNHSYLLAYAAKFGLEFLDAADDSDLPSIVTLEGRRIPQDEIKQITQEIDTVLARMTGEARSVVSDEPWNTLDAKRLDNLATSTWIDQRQLSPRARGLIAVQLASTNGVPLENQSFLGNLSQILGGGLEKYWTDSEVFRTKGGNQQLAVRFTRELGSERVLLNRPVTQIITTETAATLIDAEGNRHVADQIVLAVPPSVWATIKFTPELPAILKPQMGRNVKYLAAVKTRFWKDARLPPRATSDQIVNQIWEGTAGQLEDGQAGLVAFSGASAAESIGQFAVAQRQAEYLKVFEAVYPGFRDHFMKGRFMDWVSDPWTRAGYSFPAPGQVTTQGPMMRKGIGRLHFAGEHTCYEFVGYMEGALKSGAELARRIAVRDGLVKG